ncbi:MAG: 1-acyl-sn-glycerol-3-phosphate acyltransferase [Deltaproteobacteria bacterium]|nr:1-acyl-sn-glycerol-3-phosphate acyltransferase [Deltaproteobacteria bacterium]
MRTDAAVQPQVGRALAEPAFRPLPRKDLRGLERVAVPLGESINTNRVWKRIASAYAYHVPRHFVSWVTRRRWKLHGLEHIQTLQPPRGVILVSNHRSFFDMYVSAAALYAHASFLGRIYFPVRTSFFYDRWLGSVINYAMSGYAMWPPVFRDDRKHVLNALGLEQMAYALSLPGAVLGIHPEGTRSHEPDPYSLARARPGVGKLVQLCHADTLVLPYFIVGLGNDFMAEVRGRKHGPEIRIRYGAPLRCGELAREEGGPQAIADTVLAMVNVLAQDDQREHV